LPIVYVTSHPSREDYWKRTNVQGFPATAVKSRTRMRVGWEDTEVGGGVRTAD